MESDKPQRATAAQMANRKIKDVRRRRPVSASGPSAPPSGSPFSSIDPNIQSSMPGSQPSSGFVFGQSQSFPGVGSNPSQNASTPFAFGASSGASSFSFNSFNSNMNNPFSGLNNAAPAQPPSDGGFKGSIFNFPSSGNQNASAQAPATGLFGSQQPSSTSASFGGFGSNTATTTTGISSQSTPAMSAVTGNIFTQPSTTAAAPSSSIFGPSTPVKPSAFGQSIAFGSDSMQTSPDTNTNGSSKSIFQSSINATGGKSLFTKPEAKNETAGEEKTTFSTPAQSVFGGKPIGTPSPSIFGTPSSTSQAATTTSAAPATTTSAVTASATPATTSNPFGQSLSKTAGPLQNPFQAGNLFAPKPSEEKNESQKQTGTGTAEAKPGFQLPPSTPSSTSLFSKSTSAAPTTASNGLFGSPPAFSTPQPAVGASNLFAPKTAVPADQEASKATPSNPFGSLFASPAAKSSPQKEPAQDELQSTQKPFPSLFTSKPGPSAEEPKTNKSQGPAASTSPFSSSATGFGVSKPSTMFSPKPSPFPTSVTGPEVQKSSPAPTAPAQVPSRVNGAETAAPSSQTTQTSSAFMRLKDIGPEDLPANLDENTRNQIQLLWRVRALNTSFKRIISDLDPSVDDFDNIVLFYLRAREAIGAPASLRKRKAPHDDSATVPTVDEAPASKKVKSADTPPVFGASGQGSVSTALGMTISQSPITSTPSKLFGTPSHAASGSKKRKSNEDDDDESAGASSSLLGKRTKESERSTTASIFAQSFSKSVLPDAGNETSGIKTPSPFKSSVSEQKQSAVGSTTPTSSPSKPPFSFTAAPKESPTPAPLFSVAAASKPTSDASTTASPAIIKNPFVLKPTEDKNADSALKTAPAPPKFSTGTTDFFSQFKKQAEANAEKEKAKRKAEDYDSEEDDEDEWERKDAEEQRKKREQIEALAKNRPKFIPGKGFSFEESPATSTESKDTDQNSAINTSTSSVGTSIFESKDASSFKSTNIFGHLSATQSEVEENDADDTEEASGDEDETKDPSFVPASDAESSRATTDKELAPTPVSTTSAGILGNGTASADVISKTLEKKSEDTKTSAADGGFPTVPASSATAAAPSGGRSLFDCIQYDKDGNPERREDATSDEKASDKPFSGLFKNSKFGSSFNASGSSTSNIFSSNGGAASTLEKTPSNTSNIFGSSTTLGSSTFKPASDNTWKINTPIKFAADSIATATSESKSESASGMATPDQSKPFSTLFGGSSAGAKSAGTPQQPLFGFGFGAPSQQAKPALASSTATSDTPSRSTTPGPNSETGAEGTEPGDAAEPLPQVDLARSTAGEENEDLVLETRARGLKIKPGAGWESQGVGYLRVLKHRTTSRSRIILRADPSGKVVLNTALNKAIDYSASGNNVRFFVPQAEGPPEQWALRVKKEEVDRLASTLEECKK
ncbi:hypothetical protein MPDQ_000857 [Monascus purpureus]|uniref:RanBD1 domain-containing protein n=1 Tax=Monascus purpureus TaxID=5098 RepID=A0A507R1H2_MONPU|nr:hypothetical protein MPDQ_000857 [Monascus purpureus]